MNRLVRKLLFLWVGNLCMWFYYSGKKSMENVAKEDNETLGLIVTMTIGLLIYFSFF